MIYLKEILLVFIISTRVDAGCQDRGCSRFEEGARCYPWDRPSPSTPNPSLKGMDCVINYGLCSWSLSWSSPGCQCCNKKCRDNGCSKKFGGRGRCSDRKLSKFCFEGLCQRSKLASYGKEIEANRCQWTNWIDRNNPSGTGDWENFIWPPIPGWDSEEIGSSFSPATGWVRNYVTKVGPGTDCEYSQYRVRIKGTTTDYSDVNSLPPNPWVIHDMPNGIYCKNAEQTWMKGCGPKNPYNGKCCPDMEVKYCCKPKPQPLREKCYCCPPTAVAVGDRFAPA